MKLGQDRSKKKSGAPHIAVRVVDLVVGRSCEFPILDDQNNEELFPAQTQMTESLIRMLEQNGHFKVRVDYRDINNMMSPSTARDVAVDEETHAGHPARVAESTEIHRVLHGCEPYDEELQRALVVHLQSSCAQLNQMRTEVLSGKRIESARISDLVDTHFHAMVEDANCALSATLELEMDDRVSAHGLQLAVLGMTVAADYGLGEHETHALGTAALVHDWGMMRLPQSIIQLDGAPSGKQLFEFQRHPHFTYELLRRVNNLPATVLRIAYQVHEKIDGSGFPQGLGADEVVDAARILHIAEEFLTRTTAFPGRETVKPYAAIVDLLQEARSGQIDPGVMRAYLRVLSIFPVGSFVTLSDGTHAQVIRPNPGHFTKPIVARIDAPQDPGHEPRLVDLHESELEVTQTHTGDPRWAM